MPSYLYKVLREEVTQQQGEPPETFFRPIGEFKTKGPGAAALAGAEAENEAGNYVAVPQRNFNEIPIVPTTALAIGEVPAEDPPEPEPTGDGAAGDEIDSSLDPEAVCETEECGHLPGQHGAKGLGICRVEGCPCGKGTYVAAAS